MCSVRKLGTQITVNEQQWVHFWVWIKGSERNLHHPSSDIIWIPRLGYQAPYAVNGGEDFPARAHIWKMQQVCKMAWHTRLWSSGSLALQTGDPAALCAWRSPQSLASWFLPPGKMGALQGKGRWYTLGAHSQTDLRPAWDAQTNSGLGKYFLAPIVEV